MITFHDRHASERPTGGRPAPEADKALEPATPAQADTRAETPAAAPPDLPVLDQPLGSHFADAGAARQAVTLALPMIEQAIRDRHVCGSGFLYIVVMDPALGPADARFDDAILHEHAIGACDDWDADYGAFARAKARLSWEYRQDGQALQQAQAHRLRAGDSLLWGSVCLDGIVVGVSGAFAWYDEAFATAIAANLRAIAKQRHAEAIAAGRLWTDRGLHRP
jgi:hypothetical protein